MRQPALDGLRGWAALVVLMTHLVAPFLAAPPLLFWLPVDGTLAVYVFFVLSGYVLSIGYLQSGDRHMLAALAIRRYPRLTIPILASCLLAYTAQALGLMHPSMEGLPNGNTWFRALYHPDSTLLSVLRFSVWEVYFDWQESSLNPVLWTMRTELLGSFLVLGILAVTRTRSARLTATIGLTVFLAWLNSASVGLAAGSLMAQATCWSGEGRNPDRPALPAWLIAVILLTACSVATFRSGWLLQPAGLTALAAAGVGCVLLSPGLCKILQTRLSRWLGMVSFPLYLTHMLVICTWLPWVILQLRASGMPQLPLIILSIGSSACLALMLARAFMPVERYAIASGRWLSARVLVPTAAATA